MAQIVAGYGVSHTAMTIRKYAPGGHAAQDRVHDAFARLRAEIAALEPDLIVMVSSEHLNSFFYESFPQICVGLGTQSTGWGDAGVASRDVLIAGDFAAHLLEFGVAAGFDLSWSVEPKLDHGFMCPLTLLRPEMDIPLVPIFQNASTAPLPPFRRCAELGRMLRAAITARPTEERVLLLAGGGLSHWVATPEMGNINADFDRWFLGRVEAGDIDALAALEVDRIDREAGNGGQEIRNWITVMAAGSGPGATLSYEAIPEWATGMAVARLFER